MYAFALCALAFLAFWNRLAMAGMILVLLATVIVGLGFGQMMDSPCPLSALPPDKDIAPHSFG